MSPASLSTTAVVVALACVLVAPQGASSADAAEPRPSDSRPAAVELDLVSAGEIENAGPTPPPDAEPETVVEGDDLQQPPTEVTGGDADGSEEVADGGSRASGAAAQPVVSSSTTATEATEQRGPGAASVRRVPLARTGFPAVTVTLLGGVSLVGALGLLRVRRP